jgi:hypothetical protein
MHVVKREGKGGVPADNVVVCVLWVSDGAHFHAQEELDLRAAGEECQSPRTNDSLLRSSCAAGAETSAVDSGARRPQGVLD